MSWITENKKQIVRKAVDLDTEKAQELYDELGNDASFCLDKKIVAESLGVVIPKGGNAHRPQTLQKWLLNTITANEEYTLKIGESAQGLYIFRRVDIED